MVRKTEEILLLLFSVCPHRRLKSHDTASEPLSPTFGFHVSFSDFGARLDRAVRIWGRRLLTFAKSSDALLADTFFRSAMFACLITDERGKLDEARKNLILLSNRRW